MRKKLLVVLGIAALAAAGGCDERGDPLTAGLGAAGSGTAGFNVTPATLSLAPGQSAQLTLNSTRAIGPYNWTTNQEGVATVSENGLVNGIGPGTATITVTSSVDRTVSARATVTVTGNSSP